MVTLKPSDHVSLEVHVENLQRHASPELMKEVRECLDAAYVTTNLLIKQVHKATEEISADQEGLVKQLEDIRERGRMALWGLERKATGFDQQARDIAQAEKSRERHTLYLASDALRYVARDLSKALVEAVANAHPRGDKSVVREGNIVFLEKL